MPKKFILAIGALLLVIVVFWAGIALYSAQFNVDINPNAEQHTTQIKGSFDKTVVDDLDDRIKVLKVSPSVIQELEYRNAPENNEDGGDVVENEDEF